LQIVAEIVDEYAPGPQFKQNMAPPAVLTNVPGIQLIQDADVMDPVVAVI
jgi:hypothetical protein